MNRPKKRTQRNIKLKGSFQKVVDLSFKRKPDEEDFYVFTVLIDDPETLTHHLGYSFMGSWDQSTHALVAIMDNFAGQIKPSQIAMFQGEKARRYLVDAFKEESRYQDQRRSQPHN